MEKQEIKLRCLEAAVQLAIASGQDKKLKYVLDAAKEMVEWVGEEVSFKEFTPQTPTYCSPPSFQQYIPTVTPCSPPFEVICQSQI